MIEYSLKIYPGPFPGLGFEKAVKETGGCARCLREPAAGGKPVGQPFPVSLPSREPNGQHPLWRALPLVSRAGPPPLPGRVLLDMPEWVVE